MGVKSFDFTSSYPAVAIYQQFPMSKGEVVEITSNEDLNKNLSMYCCMFDIEVEGLEEKIFWEHSLSISKCWDVKGEQTDNGRIVRADHLCTTMNELDFQTFREFYKFKSIKFFNFTRYRKSYLPTPLVKTILELYQDKTKLKGIIEELAKYTQSKGKLNATYGMCVTDPIRDTIIYQDDWDCIGANLSEQLDEYNHKRGRFLFYPWGVWISAYARRNLFTAIKELGTDYIYSDTDSVKFLNYEKHKDYFIQFNKWVESMLKRAMKFHGLDESLCFPEVNGEVKTVGIWDDEGEYIRFKTLGAKRYLGYKKGRLIITVAGLNKEKGAEYLLRTFSGQPESVIDEYMKDEKMELNLSDKELDDIFEAFTDNLIVPANYSGRLIHFYQDDEVAGEVTDYLGNTIPFDELSGVYLEESEYSLNMGTYLDFIMSLEESIR